MNGGPHFSNDVATLELDGRAARLRLERTATDELRLECVDDQRLA
jgi:hypothetical protein